MKTSKYIPEIPTYVMEDAKIALNPALPVLYFFESFAKRSFKDTFEMASTIIINAFMTGYMLACSPPEIEDQIVLMRHLRKKFSESVEYSEIIDRVYETYEKLEVDELLKHVMVESFFIGYHKGLS